MDVSEEPRSARARSRRATRDRLVSSARGLFAGRGLSRVTSHDIARSAGVAAGTFYLHFKDKETVFREIVYEAIDRLRTELKRAMDEAAEGAQGIRGQAQALVRFAEENRDLVLIVFGPDRTVAGLDNDILEYMAAHGTEVLEERAKQGLLPPGLHTAVTAQAMVGMMERVVVWWIADPTRATREEIVDTLTNIQLGGTYAAKP
jgi:AcrR family transcriptional regulator